MPPVASRSLDGLVLLTWLALLAGVIVGPHWLDSPTLGDDLIRFTVRLSLAYYAGTVALMMLLEGSRMAGRHNPRSTGPLALDTRLGHVCDSPVHGVSLLPPLVACPRGGAHGTAERLGEGIYLSHLFTLLWTCDVAWWWLRPLTYAQRPAWMDRTLHGFMLFIVFNGTVVYESGLIRWAGLIGFVILAAEWSALRFRGTPARAALSRS